MRILLLMWVLIFFCPFPSLAFDHSHQKWTSTLVEYENDRGLVNYKKLKMDMKDQSKHLFGQYLNDLYAVTFSEYQKFAKNEKMAFLINAYNALTVKLIIDKYPVSSIKDIGSFFTKPWRVKFFSLLDGKIKALDPIEHDWLRPHFKDYRIHAAVNCASISCPPLRREAFKADQLDRQLDEQMRNWLNDHARNEINLSSSTWEISKIFDWYEDDFSQWGGGVVTVINKYIKIPSNRKLASQIQLKYLPYDWSLNEVK